MIASGTGEGQTAKVAERIAETLRDRGHDVTAVDGSTGPSPPVADSDAILAGASIRVGKHQQSVLTFVREHRDELASRPTDFFQVSLVGGR